MDYYEDDYSEYGLTEEEKQELSSQAANPCPRCGNTNSDMLECMDTRDIAETLDGKKVIIQHILCFCCDCYYTVSTIVDDEPCPF